MESLQAPERLDALRSKLALVPQSPGVYIHKDSEGKVLYVGKAKNLQARLRSYFTGLERHTPKTRALVAKIQDFEVMKVENENESLILENTLIKHNKPPYNILLRDDKTYPYLKITSDEAWPRLVQTRRRKNDGALYFGPYVNGGELQSVLSVINRFFPLVKCTPTVFKTVPRPCNYYDIKRCLGPCHLPVDSQEYGRILDNVISILRGKTGEAAGKLKKEMMAASDAMDFEKAARLRDQIRALEGLGTQQSVVLQPGLDVDIVGSFWHSESVSFYTSIVRDGKLVGGESHILKRLVDEVENATVEEREHEARRNTLSTFLCQFYTRREVPRFVCVPEGEDALGEDACAGVSRFIVEARARAAEGESLPPVDFLWTCQMPNTKETRDRPQMKVLKDAFFGLCKQTADNARNRLQEDLRVDEKNQALMLGLQAILRLDHMPGWIECYDISTFQGSETVASGVVFRDGKPSKSDYRKYIIKDVVGQDDFASMREVIRRRFKEERRHEIPDVLLIDGGEPQIREVGWVLKNLGLDGMTFVGIAKSRTARDFRSSRVQASMERLVVPFRRNGELLPDVPPETRPLQPGSPEYRLVTQLRDEAHRFAITFHRKRRDKVTLKSALQTISGLGPKRRKKLLEVFPTFSEMRTVSAEEIASKANMPLALALRVKDTVDKMLPSNQGA